MNNNNFEREKEVKVKSLTGREHEYVFEKESKPTLRMLKDMVQDHEGIPINQQRFMIISGIIINNHDQYFIIIIISFKWWKKKIKNEKKMLKNIYFLLM